MTTVVANYRERAPHKLVLDTLREHAPTTALELAAALGHPVRPVVQALNDLHDQGHAQRRVREPGVAYWEDLT